jgi:hypothetical protein
VYLAEQIRLRRYVALKLIVPEYAEDDEFRRRLRFPAPNRWVPCRV